MDIRIVSELGILPLCPPIMIQKQSRPLPAGGRCRPLPLRRISPGCGHGGSSLSLQCGGQSELPQAAILGKMS